MSAIKNFTRGLSTSAFVVLLLALATISALVVTFRSPDKIQKSLRVSGIYETLVENALTELNRIQEKKPEGDNIPTNDPQIVAAAKKAFTPEIIQNSTESILDGTYNWLTGKTKLPDYSVDLTAAKQTLAVEIANVAATRMLSLPVCTPAQLAQLNPSDIDPFTVPCLPPGMSVSEQQSKISDEIAGSKDFLANTKLTVDNLPKDENGKTVFDNMSELPRIYQLFSASPWILGVLTVVAAAVTLLLSESKRRGLKTLAIVLGVVGSVLIMLSMISGWLLNNATKPGGTLSAELSTSFQGTVVKGIDSLYSSIEQVTVWFGVIYLIIAIGILLALHFIKPDPQAADKLSDDKVATAKPKANLPPPKKISKNI